MRSGSAARPSTRLVDVAPPCAWSSMSPATGPDIVGFADRRRRGRRGTGNGSVPPVLVNGLRRTTTAGDRKSTSGARRRDRRRAAPTSSDSAGPGVTSRATPRVRPSPRRAGGYPRWARTTPRGMDGRHGTCASSSDVTDDGRADLVGFDETGDQVARTPDGFCGTSGLVVRASARTPAGASQTIRATSSTSTGMTGPTSSGSPAVASTSPSTPARSFAAAVRWSTSFGPVAPPTAVGGATDTRARSPT